MDTYRARMKPTVAMAKTGRISATKIESSS
jgi:hypothetical protein